MITIRASVNGATWLTSMWFMRHTHVSIAKVIQWATKVKMTKEDERASS